MQRNVIRGPGFKNVDAALSRVFNLGSSKSLEARIEAFNLFNWFELGNPNTNFSAATFGQITSALSPRVLQLAVKFNF
jgi:hypothetical protein